MFGICDMLVEESGITAHADFLGWKREHCRSSGMVELVVIRQCIYW